jgi:hypothetical protein
MTERKWFASKDPDRMVLFLESHLPHDEDEDPFHAAAGRKLRLFAVMCCRHIGHLLTDERSRNALDVLERYLDHGATKRQFNRAVESAAKVTCDLADAPGGVYEAACAACTALEDIQDPFEDTREVADHARSALVAALPEDEPAKALARAERAEEAAQAQFLRDIFGNPFRPVALDSAWLTSDVRLLARGIYDHKAFERMPILADALQDAGCDNEDILAHCRDPKQVHARGCWVVDLVLGKQ